MIYNAITCSIKFEVYITKAGSLSIVDLCFQLLIKQNVAMAVLVIVAQKRVHGALHVACFIYNHLLSPLSQLKWVPVHMLGWLVAGPGPLGLRTQHPVCCSKC